MYDEKIKNEKWKIPLSLENSSLKKLNTNEEVFN